MTVTYSGKGTLRRNAEASYGQGEAANVKGMTATVNPGGVVAAGTTYKMFRLPSNARIHGLSLLSWDDIDDSNDLMLDVGVGAVNGNITDDPDALTNGNDASSAGTAKLIADHANYGKQLWQFVNGQTVDPGGELDIYVTLTDHASTKAGDITIDLLYTLD